MGPVKGNGRKRLVSEINVTPLVDVMLVLLIIFMITAPMMTQGIDVDLPKTTAKSLRQEENQLIITITKDGELIINEIPVVHALMVQELEQYYAANKDQSIFINADEKVAYGDVIKVMGKIKSVGFDKVGMMTEPPEKE